MCSLGEPDPKKLSEIDVLTAMAFDARGDILSVGDRDGRLIIFGKQEDGKGKVRYEYLTEVKEK
jgi:hypothetical protein